MSNAVTYDTSYAVVLGDLGPPFALTLQQDSSPFVLQVSDAVTLAFKDDCGDEYLAAATIVDAAVGQIAVHWAAGDLLKVGNLHGQVKVVRVGEDFPQTFPSVGTIDFKVTPAISPSIPGQNFTNDNASPITQLQPVYQTSSGHCDLAASDTQAHATVVGLVLDATIASGASGRVQTSGTVVAPTSAWDAVTGQSGGLTEGAAYYVGAAGKITTTMPSPWATLVGVADSSTMLRLAIQAPVATGDAVQTVSYTATGLESGSITIDIPSPKAGAVVVMSDRSGDQHVLGLPISEQTDSSFVVTIPDGVTLTNGDVLQFVIV